MRVPDPRVHAFQSNLVGALAGAAHNRAEEACVAHLPKLKSAVHG